MRPKEPLQAVLLTFFVPGLGQIYAKKTKKALIFFFIYLGFTFLGIFLSQYIIKPESNITYAFAIFFAAMCLAAVIFNIIVFVDAYRSAKRFNEENNLPRKISWIKRILFVVGIIILFLYPPVEIPIRNYSNYIRHNVVRAFKIPADSMSPTLRIGDRVLADLITYKKSAPQRGDVIVFRYPLDLRRDFAKRLIAVGGETVEIRDGKIYINGQLSDIPGAKDVHYQNRGNYGKAGQLIQVPQGNYFVLGDNTAASLDSRYWGFVPQENLIGKVYKIYWPLNRTRAL
jgi:signal peptidase I